MITTSSFPNIVTGSEDSDLRRNSLTKEDLEGGIKKNISTYHQNINGGNCSNIEV